MQDWRDYVIPIMIGVLLGASALAWLVLTIRLEWGRLTRWVSMVFGALMSRTAPAPTPVPRSPGNHSSYAAEPPRNYPVPEAAEPVPVDRDKPITLDDLLTELALLSYIDRDGEVKQFTATKIAAFIGGRKEETLEAIRKARNEPDPEPVDGLRVRDAQGERVIAR